MRNWDSITHQMEWGTIINHIKTCIKTNTSDNMNLLIYGESIKTAKCHYYANKINLKNYVYVVLTGLRSERDLHDLRYGLKLSLWEEMDHINRDLSRSASAFTMRSNPIVGLRGYFLWHWNMEGHGPQRTKVILQFKKKIVLWQVPNPMDAKTREVINNK